MITVTHWNYETIIETHLGLDNDEMSSCEYNFGLDELTGLLADMESVCFSDAWTYEMIASSMEQAWNHLFVATVQGEMCGYLLANVVADETELLRIAVDEKRRNEGVGQALLDAYFTFATKCSSRGLLEVRHGNAAAKHLYEKNGYRLLATRKNYYKNPMEDADMYEILFQK